MNILIGCHQHPDLPKHPLGGHAVLTISNEKHTYTNRTQKNNSRNKSRKNKSGNNKSKHFKVYYIDTDPEISTSTIPETFFNSWDKVPEKSMDILWGHYCPAYFPFNRGETLKRITGINENKNTNSLTKYPVGPLLSSPGTRELWTNLLEYGKRVLKPDGKIVIPFIYNETHFHDPTNIILITRILNMECYPTHLYKVDVVFSYSVGHKEVLDNLMVYEKDTDEPKPIRLLVLSL